MQFTDSRTGMEIMTEDECYRLLVTHQGEVGRLAVVVDARPHIVPMNYAVVGRAIVLRTDDGTKLLAARDHGEVAFEVDQIDPVAHLGWSVVVHGSVSVVTSQTELMLLRSNGLEPYAAGEKTSWLLIEPSEVSGRRVPVLKRWFW